MSSSLNENVSNTARRKDMEQPLSQSTSVTDCTSTTNGFRPEGSTRPVLGLSSMNTRLATGTRWRWQVGDQTPDTENRALKVGCEFAEYRLDVARVQYGVVVDEVDDV